MRSLAFLGLAAVLAILPAAADAGGDSGAQMPGGDRDGWGAVPDLPLRAPQDWNAAPRPPAPGGWGDQGWSDGPPPGPGPGWDRGGDRRWSGGRDDGRRAGRGGRAGPAYPRAARGWRLPRFFASPDFFVSDWYAYGLGVPGPGLGWFRYYDDAVLLDEDGTVHAVRRDVDWGQYLRPGPPYADSGYGYRGGGRAVDGGAWGDDMVTWGHRWAGPVPMPPLVYQAPPGTTTIVIQTAPAVTTTTTTYVEERVYRPRRVAVRKPVRKWRPRPCSCGCVCR